MADAPTPSMSSVIFGASPATTIIGYISAIAVAADDVIKAGGLPQDAGGWKQLAIAIGIALFGRLTKQSNVTNAPEPVAARAVPEVTPLPAADDLPSSQKGG